MKPDVLRSYAFAAIDLLQSVAKEGASKPVQLFKWGINAPVDGRPAVVIDDAFAASLEQAYAARSIELAIDYNHASIFGFDAAPAAGWIAGLKVVRPGQETDAGLTAGVWLTPEWVPEGRRRILDREYRYMSAVLRRDWDTGAVLPELTGAALTNTPAIHGLQAVAASEERLARQGGADESAEEGAKGEVSMVDVLKETGYASVEELKSALSELPKLRQKADAADKAAAEVTTLSAKLTEANKALEAAQAALKTAKVDAAMAQAEALGRIPAESEKLTDEEKAARAFARKLAEASEELFSGWLKAEPKGKEAPTGRLALSLAPADAEDAKANLAKVETYAKEHKCSLGEAYEALGAAAARSN
jgi:phage I-like protein